MPRKVTEEKKRKRVVRVRVNDDEYRLVEERLPEGYTLSAWLRLLALGEKPKPKRRAKVPSCDPALVRQVARIGQNLNQTVRALNRSNHYGGKVDLVRVAVELSAIERGLLEVIRVNSRGAKSDS